MVYEPPALVARRLRLYSLVEYLVDCGEKGHLPSRRDVRQYMASRLGIRGRHTVNEYLSQLAEAGLLILSWNGEIKLMNITEMKKMLKQVAVP
jgi:hypothetical protein